MYWFVRNTTLIELMFLVSFGKNVFFRTVGYSCRSLL